MHAKLLFQILINIKTHKEHVQYVTHVVNGMVCIIYDEIQHSLYKVIQHNLYTR